MSHGLYLSDPWTVCPGYRARTHRVPDPTPDGVVGVIVESVRRFRSAGTNDIVDMSGYSHTTVRRMVRVAERMGLVTVSRTPTGFVYRSAS